jgi:hypothetical protein
MLAVEAPMTGARPSVIGSPSLRLSGKLLR